MIDAAQLLARDAPQTTAKWLIDPELVGHGCWDGS
jgi:hypothetical protein